MSSYIQAELLLDGDHPPKLFVLRVDGVESLGRPYSFLVQVVATDPDSAFEVRSAICERVTLSFDRHGPGNSVEQLRAITGLVTEVVDGLSAVGVPGVFTLRVEPPQAALAHVQGQEIFVGTPIPEIIRRKFTQSGISLPHALRLSDPAAYVDGTEETRWTDGPTTTFPGEPRLTTQYKESDLAFLMRLAEHVGLSLFFEHDPDGDVAVLTDHNGGFTSATHPIGFHSHGKDGGGHGILELRRRTRWVPTTVLVADYNYRAPTQTLQDETGAVVFDVLGARGEVAQQWPGIYVEFGPNVKNEKEAKLIAKVRAEELASACDRYVGRGHVPELTPGLRFTVSSHPALESTQELVAAEVTHTYTCPPPAQTTSGDRPTYACTFEAIPLEAPDAAGRFDVRPQRRTPKPRIHGLMSGVVVGTSPDASAELQHLDDVGRYVVRMHFAQGEMPTMPRLRMAQANAGPNYGIHFPLRPGTEVLIAFRDGDPDRPHILGAMPNALTRSPVFATSVEGAPVEPNRILTRSGILIELSDGDPLAPAT